MSLTSAAGLLAWLSEPEVEIRSWALQKLNDSVDLLWPEISLSIGQMYVRAIFTSLLPDVDDGSWPLGLAHS